MIFVIIPVFNRLRDTIRCLRSIEKQKTKEQITIIIVDDCSTDNTKEFLTKNFAHVKILTGTGSLFWGGAVSYGIDYVLQNSRLNDKLLLVNNDVELSSNTISELLDILNLKKRKAIVGALTLDKKDRKTVIKSGTLVKSWFFNITHHLYNNLDVNNLSLKKYTKVNLLTGRCLMHPIEIFKKVGNYNSKKFIHYGCDDEFSLRVQNFNYEALLCTSTYVFLNKKKNNQLSFCDFLFSKKSSSNILNKFNLTIEIVPTYAKFTFFFIGMLKSLYVFLKQ
jgi:GT2 family glycosyltransferase